MTWEEAKVIRSEYPRRLTNAHIQEILERWGVLGEVTDAEKIPNSYMFQFACTPRKDGNMNITELKLWFMFDNKQHEQEIKEYNSSTYERPGLQKIHGHIIAAWFSHIIDGGEYQPSTQNLRKRMLKQLCQTWKNVSTCFIEQVKGVQSILNIKTQVRADMLVRYPEYKNHDNPDSFENKCWAYIQKFINE
jgi:hypothetical protein